MKSLLAFFTLLAGTGLLPAAIAASPQSRPEPPLPDGLYAEITTPRGVITAELFYTKAPLTVGNFVCLAEGSLGPKRGTPFFNGLKFHRVVPNFVVQGGDPLGTGEGGPGYTFTDEFVPGLHHDAAGVLSMANSGPDTNGSQFFITLREVNRLNYLHSVFGRVVRGLEVLPLIQPNDPITTVTIRRIGPAAEAYHTDAIIVAYFGAKAKTYAAARQPGPTAHFDDPDKVLPGEPPRALNFQRKLGNFERATGRKIYARVFAQFTPETPGQHPGDFAGALAKKLNLPPTAALAVYFADTAQWALWIGDDAVAQFVGRPGTVSELTKEGALHRAQQDFLTAAKALGDQYTVEAAQAAPPDKPLTDGQKIKYQVDAVLDGLIMRFEPKS